MSRGNTSFTPTARNRQVGHDYYDAYVRNTIDRNRRQSSFPRSRSASFLVNPDVRGGAPWQPFEDTVVTGPFSLTGFPVHSQSLEQIPVLGNLMATEIHSGNRQIMQQRSPSGRVNWQPNILPVQEDNSRLNQDDEQAVLNKLKKGIYNPSLTKLARRLSLYYRDETRNSYNEMVKKQEENDAMRCAICLEDFEPKEKVMLTPCDHMFHEECIVPWVASNAQCPVCRFSLGEKDRESRSSNNNSGNTIAAASDNDEVIALELRDVLRAMEDAFIWDNAGH